MKRLSLILFLCGVTLSGWYAARLVPDAEVIASAADGSISSMDRVLAWARLAGLPFGIGLALMVVGGVQARRAAYADGEQDTGALAGSSPAGSTQTQLHQIAAEIGLLPRDISPATAKQLHSMLDHILEDLVPAFLEQKEPHIKRLGLTRYAEMMGIFATAERCLARAWSANTDEAWFEVLGNIQKAEQALAHAMVLTETGH